MNTRTSIQKSALLAAPLAWLLFSPLSFAALPQASTALAPPLLIAQNTVSVGNGTNGASANHRPHIMEQLGLTPEQSQKVKSIKAQGRSQSSALHQQLLTKRQALMKYLQSPGASETQARNMNADINETQRQLSEVRLKTWFAMRSQLTPAQLQKLNQLTPKRSSGPHGGGHGGEDHF